MLKKNKRKLQPEVERWKWLESWDDDVNPLHFVGDFLNPPETCQYSFPSFSFFLFSSWMKNFATLGNSSGNSRGGRVETFWLLFGNSCALVWDFNVFQQNQESFSWARANSQDEEWMNSPKSVDRKKREIECSKSKFFHHPLRAWRYIEHF